jgi:hypothetical protein
VFHDESNALLDDTGALRYNPSTGTLLVPNLVVAGTTTQVDTVTMEAANAVVFEGATADDHETTLTIIDPTADRTQRLINQSGYIPLLAALTTTAITSTPEELNILDGATVVVGEINALDLGSTAVGNAIASKAVILDSSKDYTGIRNLTISGEIDAATGDYSGAVDIAGATTTAAITASGIIKTDDTTAATSTTDGSLQTDGGLSVAADAVIGDDLFMLSDAAVITFGADKDVTLTHVADTGLLLNGTSVIQFNDASQNIGAPSATVLDINATDEIELNATLLDVNANINASGTYTGAGTMTTGGNIVIPNAGNIGSVGDTDSIAIASNGVVTFSQIPVMPANSIDSDEYIDGSIDREHLAADIIDGTKIADDAIDSEHYTDGSIDLAHMSANSVDSDQYVDGSIDLAHMSANSVDSDQYVDGSIDTVHIADNQITLAKMAGIARGKIIYGDASGDPAVLTAGSNGQVLSSDGTDISWTDISVSSLAADNLTAGDAAILLTTSSGNITIDAAADDSDIILKGTDGTVDTTYLTIDGSAAGAATFNSTVTATTFVGDVTGDVTGNADTATVLATARTIGGVSFNGSANINLPGVNTAGNQNTSGSAATLTTARTINGVSFNGSANITVADSTKLPLAGGTMSGNIVMSGAQTVDGRDLSVDGAKLDGIESGATADQTASEILTAIKTVDGSGSGLDADTVDGIQGASFLRSDTADTATGVITLNDDLVFAARTTTDGHIQLYAGADATGYAIGIEPSTLYNRSTTFHRWYIGTFADGGTSDYMELSTSGLTVNGTVTATAFSGPLTGDVTGNADTATALATARTIGGVSFDGSANINLPGVNSAGNQNTTGSAATLTTARTIGGTSFNGSANIDVALATLATTVTVSDSTANTNFPVVFTNESNALLDDTGALRYNPSTGTLLVPNLVVAGTTTQVDTVTMEAANAIVFEGATADAYETTLTITDPTADRTITLPDATGTVALTSSNITGSAATLTTARTIGGVSFDGSANINLPGVNSAGNQNTSGSAATLTTARTIGGVSFDGSANINLPGVNSAGNQNTSGSAATLTTARTIGGVSFNGSANINLPGVNSAGNQNTSGSAATVTGAAQSNITSLGTLTTLTVDNIIINGTNIGHTSDTDSIAIASNGVVTFSQAPVFPDGSIAVADLDIDGATDIGAAIADADLFIVDDGAGGTNRKTTAARLKTYIAAASAPAQLLIKNC